MESRVNRVENRTADEQATDLKLSSRADDSQVQLKAREAKK
jgi:hypothetical protein